MAGDSLKPLSTEQAKEHLRAVFRDSGPRAWVEDSPWSFIALGLGSGYLAGRIPAVRSSMIWVLARAMLMMSSK